MDTAEMYLDLLKRCLTDCLRPEVRQLKRITKSKRGIPGRWIDNMLIRAVEGRNLRVAKDVSFDWELRRAGRDWPLNAETMIGLTRLDNLQSCIVDTLEDNVPGDLIETGTWRGGATIFMRAVLKAYGVTDKTVWVADSFKGLPRPDPVKFPQDEGYNLHTYHELAVSLDEVKENFKRYGLLDGQVQFLPGWFRDTLPTAPINELSVLRLDGDLYESTMDALANLYDKVSVGGYVIIDDYGAVPACREAVNDFRKERGISEEMKEIDWAGVFWKKTRT